MKKIVCIMVVSIVMAVTTVFAGSVPEDMLHYDEAQLFFAEFVSYRPTGEGETEINIIPTKAIKGNIKIGQSLWYKKGERCGDFTVVPGEEYLFLYYDEYNPTCFFKTTTKDTKTLKLEHTSGDMWKRLEKYLNDGEFEKAEKKRLEDAKSRTISQLLDSEAILTKELHISYRMDSYTKKVEANIKECFELFDNISCSQIPAIINGETNVFFIMAVSDTGRERQLFISESGLVSKNNNPSASMVESAEYRISRENLNKLYQYAGVEMPENNRVYIYIISACVFIVLLVYTIFIIKHRNTKK